MSEKIYLTAQEKPRLPDPDEQNARRFCPKCGKEIVVKKTKKGRKYYGCMGNPECDFMSWQKPSARKCPVCGGMMLEKGNRLVCENRECGHVENKPETE